MVIATSRLLHCFSLMHESRRLPQAANASHKACLTVSGAETLRVALPRFNDLGKISENVNTRLAQPNNLTMLGSTMCMTSNFPRVAKFVKSSQQEKPSTSRGLS